MTSPLAERLKLKLSGVPSQVRKASMIVLALELDNLHQTLGYKGCGSWQSYRSERESGERLTWEDFCRHHAGTTEATRRNYIKAGRVVLDRLRAFPRPGTEELIRAMGQAPSTLTDDQRQGMIDDMVRLVITTDEDWRSIWKVAKGQSFHPDSNHSTAPGASATDLANLARQVGVSPANSQRVAGILTYGRDCELIAKLAIDYNLFPLLDIMDDGEN